MDLLGKEFKLTFHDNPTVFRGIEIARERTPTSDSITLHQRGYLSTLSGKFNIDIDAKNRPKIPGQPWKDLDFRPDDLDPTADQVTKYQQIQGSLQWASLCYPQCAFVINQCARFMRKPQHRHHVLQENLLRYMILHRNDGITYHRNGLPEQLTKGYLFDDIEGYADAAHADVINFNSVSTTGYFFKTKTGILMWASQKQNNVTNSTCESEVMSNRTCAQNGVWLRNLYTDLGFNFSKPTTIYQDNQSAIAVCVSDAHHKRSRHFRIACCYLTELYERGIFNFVWIQSGEMVADMFTKALKKDLHVKHTRTLTNSDFSVIRN